VLLIKTVKGFGMGKIGEGKNNVHQTKKLTDEDIKASATASTSRSPTANCRSSRSTSRPTTRPKCVPARAPQGAGRLPAHRRTKADEQFTVPSLETFKA
jgi:pyruvate dehydrogenase E1 component